MSTDYIIYSSKPPAELDRLIDRCEARLDDWLDEHGDNGEGWGEISAGGPLDTAARHTQPEIDEAGRRVRGSIVIRRPGGQGPLWNSLLVYLLTHSDAQLVLDVEGPLLPAEEVLAELLSAEQLPVFGDAEAARRADVANAKGPARDTGEAGPAGRQGPDGRILHLFARARRAVDAWEAQGLWELTAGAQHGTLAEALVEKMAELSGQPDAMEQLTEWILEREDVVELYATNEELGAAMQTLVSES